MIDPTNGLPGWAKLVSFIGLPAAIMAFFLGQQAGLIPSVQAEVKTAVERHTTETTEQTMALLDAVKEMVQGQKDVQRIQRTSCVNAAKTAAERTDCLR